MRTLQGIVAAVSILMAGAAAATPPAMNQEEAREAALQQDRGAPYVDLTTCGALDRSAQERTQLQAALDLAAADRGPSTSGGACRVQNTRQVVARIDDRYRR